MKKLTSLILVLALLLTLVPMALAEEETESIAFGITEEHSYWNESISLGVTLDEEWLFLSDEQILQLNGIVAEGLSDDYAEVLENAASFTLMYAMNTVNSSTINIAVEQLNLMNALTMSEEEYCKVAAEPLMDALGQMGLNDAQYTIVEVELDGETHYAISLTGEMNGATLSELIVAIKCSSRMVVIGIACNQERDPADLLPCFFRSNED